MNISNNHPTSTHTSNTPAAPATSLTNLFQQWTVPHTGEGASLMHVPTTLVTQVLGSLERVASKLNTLYHQYYKRFTLAAIKKNPDAIFYASKHLQRDENFLLEGIKQNPLLLKVLLRRTHKDRAFILKAVKKNGLALEHAGSHYQKDSEIALAAVTQNGLALQFVDEFIRSYTINTTAIQENGLALQFVIFDHYREKTKMHIQIISLMAIEENGDAMQLVKAPLKEDQAFALTAIALNAKAMAHLSNKLRDNPKFVLKAAKINLESLLHASERLRTHPGIERTAINHHARKLIVKGVDGSTKEKKTPFLTRLEQEKTLLDALKKEGDPFDMF